MSLSSKDKQPDSNGKKGGKFMKWFGKFLKDLIIAVLAAIISSFLPILPKDCGGNSKVDTSTVIVHKGDSVSTDAPKDTVSRRGEGNRNGTKKKKDTILLRPSIALNAFRVEAHPSWSVIPLPNGIEGHIPSIYESKKEGENPRWRITIADTAEEIFSKTEPNAWDKVKIWFKVRIVDATDTFPVKDTICDAVGESPSGIEAARENARRAAVPKIVKFVSDYIR